MSQPPLSALLPHPPREHRRTSPTTFAMHATGKLDIYIFAFVRFCLCTYVGGLAESVCAVIRELHDAHACELRAHQQELEQIVRVHTDERMMHEAAN